MSNEFRTCDLYFSAYLIAAGCVLQKSEKQMGRVYFFFEQQPFLDDLRLQYFNGEAKISALAFAAQIKNLKSLTHQTMNP